MFNIRVTLVFSFGFILGALIAVLLSVIQEKNLTRTSSKTFTNNLYNTWFKKQKLQRYPKSFDTLRYSGQNFLTESKYLLNTINFGCLVLVRKSKYVKAVKMTWATQCDYVNLVYLKQTTKLSFKKDVKNSAWFLLCNALQNVPLSVQWLLIINENTFAIMENMRFLVAPLNYSSQYYLGHSMKFWGTHYNSGQAGYIISNGVLTALKEKIAKDSCSADRVFWNLEDYYLGKTLAYLNISTSDTRDDQGLATFHGFNLQKLFSPGSLSLTNYYKYSSYPTLCCSSSSVTFQVLGIHSMFTYQYLLNQLQIFKSGTYGNQMPTTPIPEEEVWKSVLHEHGHSSTNISASEYYDFWVDLVSDPNSFLLNMKNRN